MIETILGIIMILSLGASASILLYVMLDVFLEHYDKTQK